MAINEAINKPTMGMRMGTSCALMGPMSRARRRDVRPPHAAKGVREQDAIPLALGGEERAASKPIGKATGACKEDDVEGQQADCPEAVFRPRPGPDVLERFRAAGGVAPGGTKSAARSPWVDGKGGGVSHVNRARDVDGHDSPRQRRRPGAAEPATL